MQELAEAQPVCEAAVIVGLTPSADDAIADVARTTGSRIERVAAISTDAAAFTVHTPGADNACLAVIERLRNDARIRYVEIDVRRDARQVVGQ